MKDSTTTTGTHPVILFDGVCNLCNGFVQFVIQRDPEGHFQFAALQSETGRALVEEHGLDPNRIDTVVLVENGRAHLRSDAALRIASGLGGPWPLSQAFFIVPRFIRNGVYNFIAARRYRWFGEKDQCMIPTPELRSRFLA